MSGKKNVTGLMRDPWRKPPPEPKPEEVKAARKQKKTRDSLEEPCLATIEVKGYGGITVRGAEDSSEAAAVILDLLVDNLTQVEPTLLDFGFVLAQLKPGRLRAKFYVQRGDGWTLAIPDARSRDEGCLQLIQAMMKLHSLPSLRTKMDAKRISPYRM